MDRLKKFSAVHDSKKYSVSKVNSLKEFLEEKLKSHEHYDNFCILTNGSYARNEASEGSDIDLFIICDADFTEQLKDVVSVVQHMVQEFSEKEVGDSGTFNPADLESIADMLNNLGGVNDSNIKLTRRMLFLLEGIPLFNEEKFNSYRNELLSTYIKPGMRKEQVNRFLLNDIVRYYRTICTDFEYKVEEAGKSWALRNIKLVYSRKLLYMSGIITVAQTYDLTRNEKISEAEKLFSMSALERILHVCEDCNSRSVIENTENFLALYDEFLSCMSSKEFREKMDQVQKEDKGSYPEFVALKRKSKMFSGYLEQILKQLYEDGHPIHNALIF